jgi:hypothetical protein
MVEFFSKINQFVDTVITGLGNILAFLGSIGILLIKLITILPTPLSVITVTCLPVFTGIVIYKIIRKG